MFSIIVLLLLPVHKNFVYHSPTKYLQLNVSPDFFLVFCLSIRPVFLHNLFSFESRWNQRKIPVVVVVRNFERARLTFLRVLFEASWLAKITGGDGDRFSDCSPPSVELRVAFRAFHEPSENAREMKPVRKKAQRHREGREKRRDSDIVEVRVKKKSICRQWIFDKAFSIENGGETFRGRERDLAKYDWKSCNEVSGCYVRN